MRILSLLAVLVAAEALRAPCVVASRPAVALRSPSAPLASAASATTLTGGEQPRTVGRFTVGRLTLPSLGPRVRSSALLALSLGLASCAPALASAGAATEHLHLGQKIALFFQKTGLPDWAVLMLISATPAVELRGGVPVGNWMGMSPALTFAICVLGNMFPIIPTLLALRSAAVKKIAAPLLARAEKKLAGLPSGQSRTLALALFVGIPAPGTGAWTGAIIAYLLDMPFATAIGSIFGGVLVAGAIFIPRWQKQYRTSEKTLKNTCFGGLTKNAETQFDHLGYRG